MSWTTKKLDQYCIINQQIAPQVFYGCLAEDETINLAIKTIKLDSNESDNIEEVKQTLQKLQMLNNINIALCVDVIKANQMLHFVYENYEEGNLKDYLIAKKEKFLSERESIYLLRQIIQAYQQLHQNGIIHNNIKPTNILIKKGVIKLSDPYYSGVFSPYKELCSPTLNAAALQNLQYPCYLSPQVLFGQLFTDKCDVWSMGLILFEVLYSKLPWDVSTIADWIDNIKKYPFTFPIRPIRSQAIKDLISKMLAIPENDRISFEELIQDPIIMTIDLNDQDNSQQPEKYKDEFDKAVKQNFQFLIQNRVRGFFKNINYIPEEHDSITPQIEARIQKCQFSKNYQVNFDVFNRRLKNDKFIKVYFKKFVQYFTFQRNIALFYDQLSQKLITLFWDLQLPIDLFHRLLYLIVKNLMIQIQNLIKMLNQKQNDQFDKEYWGRFQKSKQYNLILQQIEEDFQNLYPYYEEIANKVSQFLKEEYEKNKNKQLIVGMITNFLSTLNDTFEANETFNVLYRENIQDCLKFLKTLNSKQVDINLFHYYLLISLNPYDEFKDINYDFNLFYEDSEYYSIQELTEKISKKIK